MVKRKTLRKGSSSSKKDNYEYDENDGSDDDGVMARVNRLNNENDDESIDDNASEVGWNDEDEEMFGQFFNRQRRESDVDDEDDFSNQEEAGEGEMLLSDLLSGKSNAAKKPYANDEVEEEEEYDDGSEDGEDKHSNLLRSIEKFSQSSDALSKKTAKKANIKAFEQSFRDSPFSSIAGRGAVTMDTLLGALDETRGVQAVRGKLKDMNKVKAPKYVDKVVSDRIERGILYEESKADMDKWKAVVSENRHARTLDLTADTFVKPSHRTLVHKFEPMTDMEREIQMVLVKSKASEEEVAEREADLLSSREMDEEELQARQAELGKVRALMFYEQMKRHRINKIKSKAYHRIRKKQKQRREAGDGGDSEDEEAVGEGDDAEYRRVKERMDLKHKNTGKWAKMALTYSKGDKSLRQAYHESIELGHELVRKINEDGGEGEAEGEEYSEWREETNAGLADRASRELRRLGDEEKAPAVDGKFKKLFEMGFMKKAASQQREVALEEAQSVLRELRAMEDDGSDAEESSVPPVHTTDAKKLSAAAATIASMMSGQAKGGLLDLRGSKGGVRVNGNINIASDTSLSAAASNPWLEAGASKSSRKYSQSSSDVVVIDSSKGAAESSAASSLGKRKVATVQASSQVVASDAVQNSGASDAAKKKAAERKPLLMQKSQEDLVQMAFAGPDYEQEFDAVKRKTVDEEIEADERKQKILAQGTS